MKTTKLIRHLRLFGLGILLAAVSGLHAATTNWTVEGTKVMRDGESFLFKGVNYSPVPYGASTEHTPPYGSYFIPKAAPIFNRDIPLMRAMGVNAIRLYAGNSATVNGLDLGDYQQFLDTLWNDGNDPIHVFLYYWHMVGQESKDNPEFTNLKNNLVSLLDRWKDHPAVVGMVISNETEGDVSVWGREAYWQGIGEIADALKQVAPNKLVINAMVDDGDGNNFSPKVQAAYQYRQYLDNLDVIGINCYRGADLGTKAKSFGSAASNSVFLGYSRSWPNNPKPLLITEFGISWGTGGSNIREADSPEQVAKGKDYIRDNWVAIRNNHQGKDGDPSVSAGGFVFNWVDEWYKIYINGQATPLVHNANVPVSITPAFPGGQYDEEWFGIMRIDNTKVSPSNVTWDINNLKPDPLIKRGSYDVLQSLWKTAKRSVMTSSAQAVASPIPETPFWETWFGIIYEDSYPWIYHSEHDWVYVLAVSADNIWVYDEDLMDWFWTSEEVYPGLTNERTSSPRTTLR